MVGYSMSNVPQVRERRGNRMAKIALILVHLLKCMGSLAGQE